MPIQTRVLPRTFSYMGLQLADPDPALTPEQVRDAYAAHHTEAWNHRGTKHTNYSSQLQQQAQAQRSAAEPVRLSSFRVSND